MALSASISLTLGSLSVADFDRIIALLEASSLPTTTDLLTIELCEDAVRAVALHRGGSPHLVIPHGIGRCDFISDASILGREVLETSIARLNAR